jgi:hypothetical protein
MREFRPRELETHVPVHTAMGMTAQIQVIELQGLLVNHASIKLSFMEREKGRKQREGERETMSTQVPSDRF